MTSISRMTAIDPRSDWEKISRRQLWRGAKNLKMPFPTGATADVMIELFMANGFAPEQVTNFVPIVVPTEDGKNKVVMAPEEKERKFDEQKESRRIQEFERRIEEGVEKDKEEKKRLASQNAEVESLKSEVNDIKGMLSQILQSLPTAQPVQKKPEVPEDLNKMHWKKFQKLAKTVGETWTTKDPREPIIAKLEASDNVEESPAGS